MYYESIDETTYRLKMVRSGRIRFFVFADAKNVIKQIEDCIDDMRARGYRFAGCEKITKVTRTEHINF